MCVALSPELAVTSFVSCIAEKIQDKGRDIEEIFQIRFEPEIIIDYTRVLKRYDDVTRCFTEETLKDAFKNKWKDIFEFDSEGCVKLKEDNIEGLRDYPDDYAKPIVKYLVLKMKLRLNKYTPDFLKEAGIYRGGG
jgi:hypothetical protein